jgi:hypothetical protein
VSLVGGSSVGGPAGIAHAATSSTLAMSKTVQRRGLGTP